MELFLNILLIAAILAIGLALWQTWVIVKKGNPDEKLSAKDAARVDRWFGVLKIGIYAIVVIIVLRLYASFMSG